MTSTSGFLRVPLRLQALCLDTKQNVVRAMADYRLLPAETDSKRQLRSPNLSDPILTPPFTRDQELLPGIHLHWLMPDALTQGEQDGDFTRFPHVPNRWLILRSGGGQPEKQWVVESDYLYPAGYGEDIGSEAEAPVNVQVLPDPAPGPGLPLPLPRPRALARGLAQGPVRLRPRVPWPLPHSPLSPPPLGGALLLGGRRGRRLRRGGRLHRLCPLEVGGVELLRRS